MRFDFWMNASSRRKRIYSIVFVLIVALIMIAIGSVTPVSEEEAREISDTLNRTSTRMEEEGTLVPYIFGNNFMITLLMFVPVIGPILGMFILYSTGVAIGAISMTLGVPSWLSLIALVITPVGWLEFAAYSTAMAESIWLFRRILQRRIKHELRIMCIFVTITAILLIVGAIVETYIISLA